MAAPLQRNTFRFIGRLLIHPTLESQATKRARTSVGVPPDRAATRLRESGYGWSGLRLSLAFLGPLLHLLDVAFEDEGGGVFGGGAVLAFGLAQVDGHVAVVHS